MGSCVYMSYAFIQINMVVDDVLDIVGNLRLVLIAQTTTLISLHTVYTHYTYMMLCAQLFYLFGLSTL